MEKVMLGCVSERFKSYEMDVIRNPWHGLFSTWAKAVHSIDVPLSPEIIKAEKGNITVK